VEAVMKLFARLRLPLDHRTRLRPHPLPETRLNQTRLIHVTDNRFNHFGHISAVNEQLVDLHRLVTAMVDVHVVPGTQQVVNQRRQPQCNKRFLLATVPLFHRGQTGVILGKHLAEPLKK